MADAVTALGGSHSRRDAAEVGGNSHARVDASSPVRGACITNFSPFKHAVSAAIAGDTTGFWASVAWVQGAGSAAIAPNRISVVAGFTEFLDAVATRVAGAPQPAGQDLAIPTGVDGAGAGAAVAVRGISVVTGFSRLFNGIAAIGTAAAARRASPATAFRLAA